MIFETILWIQAVNDRAFCCSGPWNKLISKDKIPFPRLMSSERNIDSLAKKTKSILVEIL